MPGTETASASTPTVVSATTAATPNSTSGALSRRPSRALLSQHSSISGLAFPNRSSPPNSLSRFPTVSSLASARDGAFDSTAAAAVAGHQTKTFQERRRGSQQDLYSSLLRPDRSRSVSPSAAAPLSQRRLLSRSSSSSSSHDTHVRPPPTPVVAAAAAVPPGVSVQPRSPPASRLQPFRSSSSRSSLSIGSSPVQQRPHPQHSSSGDGNVSTMVSATTAGQSSITNIAVSQREEGEGGAERHRHLTAGSRNLSINISNSVALTLLAGPPPPSGLRDPVTLLQLLPVDLLLQATTESPLGPSSGTLKWSGKQQQQQYSTVERRERGRQTPTTPATAASASSSLACDYRRAFSLLRCAKQPVASLHSSLAWQAGDGSDSLEATLGSVMMELMHRSNAAGAPLASHQTFSPAPRTSAAYAHLKDQQNRASGGGGAVDGEETVPLCSLAAAALSETSAGRDDADIDDDDDIAAAEAGVVPLICFAATVECPPDIRRCLLLSRTHAYLCDLDGTIAYCAAIHDVRQVVTCAGGYMVWRFVSDALVRTMYTVNTGDERRRAGEAVATSTGGGARSSRPSNPTSLLAAQRMSGNNMTASASSVEAPATVWGMRDEMSDWVFHILSVGATSPPTPATATTAATTTTGTVSAALPMESGGVGDAAPLPAASPRDDGLAEERMSAMVFLIEVMCTLRTLPRLLMDAVVAGSAATPSTSASGSEEGFSQPQHYSGSDAQRLRLRSARGQSTDQLDRMHVPGDRPARVPLLLEGAVGHQTAVKFVEHYWTTRYDQLPPLLRPRRLLVAGAGPSAPSASPSAMEGGRGARVCRVASSLHIPAIPVAALSACLGAEESVTSMLETARTAARASLTEDRSPRGRGEASSPLTPATAASATHALSLRDMRSPAAQADAQATLSPAAWRVLQSMLRPDDSTETSAPPQRTLHAAHHFVPATGLTTPTTPNAAQTRAHSEDGPSLSSRSSASSSSSGAAAGGATSPTSSSAEAEVTRDTAVSCDAASQPVRAERGEEKAEAAPSHPLCNDLICAAAETRSADACSSVEVGTTYSEKDDEAPATTTAGAEMDLAPLSAVHEEPQRLSEARHKTSVKGECLSAGGNSLTTKSSSSSTTTRRSRHEEVRQEEPVSVSSSRSAVSASARRAITAARLRRQRRAGTEEQTDDAVAAVTAQHTSRADERLSSPSADAATEKKTDSAVADTLSLRVAPASPDLSVDAFERRVAHRPARDRLVLRARYIQQLLQPPLLSSANAVSHGGHSVQQTSRSHTGSYQDATCSLPDVDADRLVEDLRRQRMIAELMLHQQREDAVLKAATAAAANTAAVRPPRDEVGGPRWRATALQERVQRNSRPDSYD